MLSFEEKITALASIRALGLSKAVFIFSKLKRCPSPTMREELDQLEGTHYLLDDGFVEKTQAGTLQYVEFNCPQQPIALTKEYFDKCKKAKQENFMEALAALNCTTLLRVFKPVPFVRNAKYGTAQKTQAD